VPVPTLLPVIPSLLAETSAIALEWPRLREYLAGKTVSTLGRAWVLALEPSADLVWIADMRSEGELDDALRIARARTSEKTRVVVEAATLVGCDGLAAIRDHATRFGFCVLRTDRAARRMVLAAVPRQAMAA